VKPVLSRRKVAALLQGLSQDRPDQQIPEPGPAQERLDSEGFREKTGNQAGCRKDWPRDGNLTLFNPFDNSNGNDTNNTP
jgi:hypothetical protein